MPLESLQLSAGGLNGPLAAFGRGEGTRSVARSETVVSYDSASGQREMMFRGPCPALRAHVWGYCGYFESTAGRTRRVELSSGVVGLIIGFGPPVGIAYPRLRSGSTAHVTSFVAGLHDSYAVAESTGWQHGVEIDLTPIGAHMLLGVPMDSLANRVVELEHVLGRFAARLAEQLYETESWPARFDLLDAAIASRLAAAREPAPAISWAWRRLNETGGRLGIGALADELGSSRQYLVTKFREAIGLPPKTLARILRFQRAIQLLERADHARLTRVARECGYYDQAHFNRDFHHFAGSTPSEFLARRLPDRGGVLLG
jgi:AraC-like DNA-binding protein